MCVFSWLHESAESMTCRYAGFGSLPHTSKPTHVAFGLGSRQPVPAVLCEVFSPAGSAILTGGARAVMGVLRFAKDLGYDKKKKAIFPKPLSPEKKGLKKKEDGAAHHCRGGADSLPAGQCQGCTGSEEKRRRGQHWRASLRARQAKLWSGSALGLSARSRSAVEAGAKRHPVVPQ